MLSERNAESIVRSPDRPARAPDAFNNNVEIHRNSIRRGDLKTRARCRQVSDGTFKFGGVLAEDDLRVLENAFTEDGSFVLHVTVA